MFRFFTLFLLLYSTLFSVDLTITDGFEKINNFSLKYYYDENSLLNIEDIEKIDFLSVNTPLPGNNISDIINSAGISSDESSENKTERDFVVSLV